MAATAAPWGQEAVQVHVRPSHPSLQAEPSVIRFTKDNWDIPVKVTLTALDDEEAPSWVGLEQETIGQDWVGSHSTALRLRCLLSWLQDEGRAETAGGLVAGRGIRSVSVEHLVVSDATQSAFRLFGAEPISVSVWDNDAPGVGSREHVSHFAKTND